MINRSAIERALEILGPLVPDPLGQKMSKAGAESMIINIAEDYERRIKQNNIGPRPGKVKSELLAIVKKAKDLEKAWEGFEDAIAEASDLAHAIAHRVAFDEHGHVQNQLDTPLLRVFLYGHFPPPTKFLHDIARMKAIHEIAAKSELLEDKGGRNLRAMSRLYGTPNHWFVAQCRSLLHACGRPCGGSTGGSETRTLPNFLAAVREIAQGPTANLPNESEFHTYDNDILEVLKKPYSNLEHQLQAANMIFFDLNNRKPEGDNDLEKARSLCSEILERLVEESGADIEEWRNIFPKGKCQGPERPDETSTVL